MSGPALCLAPVLLPLLLAAVLAVPRLRARAVLLVPAAALPGLALALFGPEVRGDVPVLLLGASFGLDAVGRPILLLSGLLWFAAGLHALGYLRGDERRPVFCAWFLLSMAGSMGVALAQDVVGFLASLSLMSLAAYGLIVHDRRAESVHAGRVYLALVVVGDMAILDGLLLSTPPGGGVSFSERAAMGSSEGAGLLLAGFGIMAGVAPLHVWLPLAHPAAPAPASAVLSGAMLKAGLLGWLRLLPLGEPAAAAPSLGWALVAAGLVSAFLGVGAGLTQRDPKVLLAYSSISQMGLITVPIGMALVAPARAPVAVAAALVFAVHHALAKGALFLGVGALGWAGPASRRRDLLLLVGMGLPAAALAGLPLTSGWAARAALTGALAADPSAGLLELALALSTIGTTLLMTRLLVEVWSDRAHAGSTEAMPWSVGVAWALLVAASACAGWLLEQPAAGTSASGWTTLVPVAIGVTGGALGARFRADLPRAWSRLTVPPGDLLVLVWPLLRGGAAAWRALEALPGLLAGRLGRPRERMSATWLDEVERRWFGSWERIGALVLIIGAALLGLSRAAP